MRAVYLEDVRLKEYVSSLPGRREAKGICEQFT